MERRPSTLRIELSMMLAASLPPVEQRRFCDFVAESLRFWPDCAKKKKPAHGPVETGAPVSPELCPALQGHLQLAKEVVGQSQVALPVH